MTTKSSEYGRRRLYLMRHGHVDYFAPDVDDFRMVPLTEEGQHQANAAGEALSSVTFDHVFHSGLPRTIETARRVMAGNEACQRADIPVEKAETLEELRGGTYVTDSREELAARLAFSFDEAPEEGADFLPGGELFSDAYDRIVDGFQDLVLAKRWKTALLVAHEGVNRLLLGYACKGGLSAVGSFEQDLACINVLDIDVVPFEGRAHIERIIMKAINITPYDYVKSGLPRTSLEHLFDVDFGGARPIAL